MKTGWLLLLTWGIPLFCIGQVDTVVLSLVEITAPPLRDYSAGSTTLQWDTEGQSSASTSVADLLHSEGNIFIKRYGGQNLATSSIRGGSAGHTHVLWNGLPLQNPMLGLLDLSLLPVEGVESVRLQKGGQSALWGSGAIGGVVGLDHKVDFKRRFSASLQTLVGSFGALRQSVHFGGGTHRWQSTTKVLHHQSVNDFPYTVGPTVPKRRLSNAKASQQNVLQDLYFQPNTKNRLAFHFWQQYSKRHIPPTTTQTKSEARQTDRATRLMTHWKHTGRRWTFHVKAGLFHEHLNYIDEAISLEAPSQFTTAMADASIAWYWQQKHRFFFGVTQTYTRARSNGYGQPPTETKTAVLGGYLYQSSNWLAQALLRQEWADGVALPLVPILGLEYRLWPGLLTKASVSRNYRLPTLNDRYWAPGGNILLEPESGWSEEATLEAKYQRKVLELKGSLTGFNRTIRNWILWSRAAGQTFWSANNIARVWSRGVEIRLSADLHKNDITINLQTGYDYIRSTNQVALDHPRIEKGTQLIYTPRHQTFAKFSASWRQYSLSYSHQYTGDSEGINESLPAYDTGQLQLLYDMRWPKYKVAVFFNVNNLWDVDYYVVERRPMPGIHLMGGVRVGFFE